VLGDPPYRAGGASGKENTVELMTATLGSQDQPARWASADRSAMLVRGGSSQYVRDEDVERFQRRLPSLRYEVVEGAGHAVQSDRPLELVALIRDFAVAS
jgi:pimeloyl-ACP methyl ester carboxylesterase